MATVTVKLSIASSNTGADVLRSEYTEKLTVIPPHVNNGRGIALQASAVSILGSNTPRSTIYLKNLDATNYIILTNDAGNIWGRLLPGEFMICTIPATVGLKVQANVADCNYEAGFWTR